MTARDRWTDKLLCPNCGKIGEAKVSQNDGYAFMSDRSTQVDYCPPGFRPQEEGPHKVVMFYCTECNVSAG
jgi:hypothetical protein